MKKSNGNLRKLLLIAIIAGIAWMWNKGMLTADNHPKALSETTISEHKNSGRIPKRLATITNAFPTTTLWKDEKNIIRHHPISFDSGQAIRWQIFKDGVRLQILNARKQPALPFPKTPGSYTLYLEQEIAGKFRVISDVMVFKTEELVEVEAKVAPEAAE